MQRVPELKTTSVLALQPTFFTDLVIYSIAFIVIYVLAATLPARIAPKWYTSDEVIKKRSEIPSFTISLAHHLVVVPLAIFLLCEDWNRDDSAAHENDYLEDGSVVVAFTFAYFIVDTLLYAVPEAIKGKTEYLYHHFLALLLISAAIFCDNIIGKFYAHILICELSTVLFTAAWFMRLAGYRGSSIVVMLELLFAFTFFLTRIVNMPLVLYSVWNHAVSLGVMKYTLIPIQGMQIYWFVKIVMTLTSRNKRPVTKKEE